MLADYPSPMNRQLFYATVWLAMIFTAGAADTNSATGSPPPSAVSINATNQRTFQVRGVVMELDPDGVTARVKHEEIPGYMPAMTMPIEVKDTNELAGLAVGDSISFRLIVTEDDGWMDQVRKLDVAEKTGAPTTGSFRFVRDVEPLNVGDLLPDYTFTNQAGQPVHLEQYRGQALALTFIFTRCPFPTFCPLMSSNFEKAQNQLLATTNGPTNWQLLTLSIDPEYDTPAILKGYAEARRYNPKHWSFAVGSLVDVTALAEQFGMYFWREGGTISHNLRTVVIGADGRIRKIIPENKWTADELVAEMIQAAKRD